MECEQVKDQLSEYMDGTLEPEIRAGVEDHLSVCPRCSEDLASLQTVVSELGSLDPVGTPDDFLEQLHDRMEGTSGLKRLIRTLFVPVRIKLPLELATALTAAILVFIAITADKPHVHIAKIEERPRPEASSLGKRSSRGIIHVALRAAPQKGAVSPPAGLAAEEQSGKGSAEKGEAERLSDLGPAQARVAREKSNRELREQTEARVLSLIALARGDLVSQDQDPKSSEPRVIAAEIPAENYAMFVAGLASLGTLDPQPPPPDRISAKRVSLRVRIIPPPAPH